ncbi:MAG TPA: NAD(P)H-hydrate epimerase, partial [Micrococcaceae bacterium]|nr:NAD(P)H-hydrate epimerase [Micrococcaceae bacterium]
MLAAYTGTQVRAAEEPLLRAGEGDALMQRAAHGLAGAVAGLLRQRRGRVYGARVLVLAGPGNNGGDALFAAAALARRGARTTAVLTAARTHPAALAAFVAAGGRTIELADDGATEQALAEAGLADAIVDGILGTGASGGLREPAAFLVRQLEGLLRGLPGGSGGRAAGEPAGATGHPAGATGHPAVAGGQPAGAAGEPAGKASRLTDRQGSRPGRPAVVACDLPSGVDADTGQVSGPVLTADLTVTFGAAKTGLLTPPGEGYAGTIQVIDIGLADRLPVPEVRRLEAADLAALLPAPARTDQKYSRGLLGIVAGSAQYPGAAQLSCAGALACGVGMVRYLGPASVAALIHAQSPEVVCSEGAVGESRVQAWLVGPGLDGEDQRQRARDAFASGLPVVADA